MTRATPTPPKRTELKPRVVPPASVLGIALLLCALSLVPTLQGYATDAPPDRTFMGFPYMPRDHLQYAGFIRQAHDTGRLLLENPFTGEPQRPSFLLLYFWILGVFTRLTGASVPLAWEIFRVAGGVLYVVVFWWMTGRFIADSKRRVIATGLFAFAGGLGWLATLARATLFPAAKALEYPYDYFWNWSTFGTMVMPNWVWPGLTFMAACLIRMRRGRFADLLTFALLPTVWFLHAYSGMVAYLCFGLLPLAPALRAVSRFERIPWPRVRENLRLAAPGLLSFGIVAAYLLWASTDQVFHLNSLQGFTWTAKFSIWWYPLGYGALLPLAWYGLRAASAERTGLPDDLLISWLLAAFVLSINPWYAGVKFHYLIFPPLALLAARGIFFARDGKGAAASALRSTPVMICLGLVLLLDAPVSLLKEKSQYAVDQDLYNSAAQLDAMRWLDAQPDGLVLSDFVYGTRIPWLAGKKVYQGHWFMTVNLREKSNAVAGFFSPDAPSSFKTDLLRRSGARYVFTGPEDRAGPLDASLPLKRVYENGGIVIYEVTLPR